MEADQVFEIAGIGFGPANLALAIAIAEDTPRTSALFLEKQPRFGWHRGMLLENATMQVSFLKDLVTLRNPASPFSFLSYLHQQGRLADFINHKSLFPLRVEFHDYLEWAAAKVDGLVRYGHEVIDVIQAEDHFEIVVQGPRIANVYRARNLVIATGLQPSMPDGVKAGERIWHSSELLTRVETLTDVPRRFMVVGAGQSAAEVTAFLHERFDRAEIRAVFSRYGYSPADDSPFANRVFDAAAVNDFFHAPQEVKQMLDGYHRNTNYSVVDLDLINELYRRSYQEKVLGAERLHLHNVCRLIEAEEVAGGVRARIESLLNGDRVLLDTDILVCATGYTQADPVNLLGDGFQRDESGRLLVGRDYRLLPHGNDRGGVYLQGGTEHTHGITSSLLSNVAVRADEILRSIRETQCCH